MNQITYVGEPPLNVVDVRGCHSFRITPIFGEKRCLVSAVTPEGEPTPGYSSGAPAHVREQNFQCLHIFHRSRGRARAIYSSYVGVELVYYDFAFGSSASQALSCRAAKNVFHSFCRDRNTLRVSRILTGGLARPRRGQRDWVGEGAWAALVAVARRRSRLGPV